MESQENSPANLSEVEKAAIREQLDRLLANPFFSHSKRFPSFLRFVIEHTLDGDAENIKERTLGIEIFGREADYDTSSDPIVRVTAAEVRKRVAQYYQEPAHRDELRITLPSGSYIPQFQWPKAGSNLPAKTPEQEADEAPAGLVVDPGATQPRHSSLVLVSTCIAVGMLSVAAVLLWQTLHRSALDFFWRPVLNGNDTVLLCIADQTDYSGQSLRDAEDPAHQVQIKPLGKQKDGLNTVAVDDLNAIVKIAGLLQSNGKQYNLRGDDLTNLADLRSGPTVFFGAFDNAWTLRLTNPLRYRFRNNSEMTQFEIVDSMDPKRAPWIVYRTIQVATNDYRDYAIVARFTDINTGKLTVIVAGLARGGTIVAGEFLTDENLAAELERAAKAAGDKKNMEIVLSTQIIDGEPGSPKMEAAYFW